MRTIEEIIADPQATRDEILILSITTALAHPNCPPDLWWDLAYTCPVEALASTSYPLMILEDPARWTELEQDEAENWIAAELPRLSYSDALRFMADVAERILWLCQEAYPDETAPEDAISAARALAAGRMSQQSVNRIKETAVQFERIVRETPGSIYSSGVYNAVACATSALWRGEGYAWMGSEEAARAQQDYTYHRCVFIDNIDVSEANIRSDKARTDEFIWQWRHLLEYINGTR